MCLSVCAIQYSTQPHTHTRTHARSHSFWRTLALFAALVQSVIVAAAHSRAATQLPTYWRLSMYMCVLLFIRVGVCVHGCPSMHSVTCVLQRVCASKQCKKVLSAKTLFAWIYIYIYIYMYSYIVRMTRPNVVTTVSKFCCCIFTFTLAAVTGPAGVALHYFYFAGFDFFSPIGKKKIFIDFRAYICIRAHFIHI